jgi:hypothetical protein
MPGEMCVDVFAPGADERTYEVARAGRQHGKPAWTCASEEPQDDGLGPIVGVMPRRENVGSGAACSLAKGRVPRVARSSLEVASWDHTYS